MGRWMLLRVTIVDLCVDGVGGRESAEGCFCLDRCGLSFSTFFFLFFFKQLENSHMYWILRTIICHRIGLGASTAISATNLWTTT